MLIKTSHAKPSVEQLLAIIAAQTEIVQRGLDLQGVMELVVERGREITEATGAVLEIADGEDMVYRAVAGACQGQLGLRLARKTSLSGLCVATGETLTCMDSETDPRVDREACRKVGLRSMVVVPLVHDARTVGALKVFSDRLGVFGASHLQLLSLMSTVIAAAMDHAARYSVDEIFRQATRDSLTGLANRALFQDRLKHGLSQAKRNRTCLALLMIDMDGLKPINDQFGHRAGDAALCEMGRRLSMDRREIDTVARLGGDEFALILPNVRDRAHALAAIQRITGHCDGNFTHEDMTMPIGASMGLGLYPEDASDSDRLVEHADLAMYATKRERKGQGISRGR
jgi:diguanylate cyclase (GGDEF)-like protein